jgi:hypothetical protein
METYKTEQKITAPEMVGTKASVVYPAVAEIKIDGEFNLLFVNKEKDGEVHTFLVNKGGKVRTDCAITKEAATLGTSMILVGELYYGDGKAGSIYQLLSHQEDNDLHFMVFDIIEYEDTIQNKESLMERKETIAELFQEKAFKNLSESKIEMVGSEEELDTFFKKVTDMAYEGIVVKSCDSRYVSGRCSWYKNKLKSLDEFEISKINDTDERIEISIIVDDTGKVLAEGVKCVNRIKSLLKVGDTVLIEHLGKLDSGSLRNPVIKGKVTAKGTEVF